ncbi:hypothetical protein MSTE_04503 [Mycobacteroides stephanolepidis]|uniref:Uncharacterized protein n=1 Tax=[Mycobacterium] stephanolepidis TaxID=1520670 RepID=A0A1Z4F3N5_9MYCO|nr:hypothetical protein [[Mycobacterium] stephanolepidis]BAX99797.1 hypothetical protein MSTE_04503 [[Mycobacterium] stephanolepidis]
METQNCEPQGVEYLQLGLSGKTAGMVADLVSIQRDIVFAQQCAEGYLSRAPTGPSTQGEDSLVAQALWSAGAISYRRAFTSGRGHLVSKGQRLKLHEAWTDMLAPEQLVAHEKILEMTNQHIAHRVGDHEGVRIIALLTPPPMPRAIAGVGHMLLHMIGPEACLAERMLEICGMLNQGLEQEISNGNDLLTMWLSEQDINELYAASESQT